MELNNIKIDKYGDLIIGTPKYNNIASNLKTPNKFSLAFVYPNDNIPLNKFNKKTKNTYVMKNDYLIYNCNTNEDGSRDLTLNGKDLFFRIGLNKKLWFLRRFQNWDVPYLSIFLSKNKDITTLNLPNNEINCAGFISLIDCIIVCDHIIELNVQNNEIRYFGIDHMLRNGSKLKLRILRLSGNKFGVKIAKKVAMMLSFNPFIRQLDVAEIDQNESSLIYFITVLRNNHMYSNETLKVLDLSRPSLQCCWNKFDNSHVATSIGIMLRNNNSLEELHLQKFGFSCHDIEEMFENARYNTTLKVLDLNGNNIGDYAAELLGNWLRKRPVLRSLLLGHNIINDCGLRLLCRGIRFSKLIVIDLSYNYFTDEGGIRLLYSIKKSPLVNQLRVYGNKIGHPMGKLLEKLLLSKFLEQENIDVKPYEVDGIFYLAHYNRQNYIEPSLVTQSCHNSLYAAIF